MKQAAKTSRVFSQKKLFEKAFLQIKKNVTREDRLECSEELQLARVTVDRYVNGHIFDNSTAYKILSYLKKKIEKRNKSLQ